MQSPQGGSMPGVFNEYQGGAGSWRKQGERWEEVRLERPGVSTRVVLVCHGKVLGFYSESQDNTVHSG